MAASQTRLSRPTHHQTGRQTGRQLDRQQANKAPDGRQVARHAVTSSQSTSQASDSPDSDAVGVLEDLNVCLRCKFELKTTNVQAELDMERSH